jgi:endoglycosylceramidase
VAACACSGGAPKATTSSDARPPVSLPALHATRGASPGIFDARGRQVLLRGVNLNALGDYYQADPSEPPVVPFSDSELDAIAAQGFDVVRLVLSWSALEPERGKIDQEEIARIERVVEAAGARGLYVVLDMHQDAWGKFIATPPGVTCPAGTQRAIGWDGAPRWATITDGASTCRQPGVRELAPAVTAAFEAFYADRDGIQDQFVEVWRALATAFAANPTVAGYDLFNEPHFGTDAAATDRSLAALYGRLIDTVREAEEAVPQGFSHIVFFEPNVLWSGLGHTATPAPELTADTNIVFSPHLYAGSLAPGTVEEGFDYALEAARSYGTTMWTGEWGWFGDPVKDEAKVAAFAAEQDKTLTGGAWWQWSQACGDPHAIKLLGNPPPDETQAFNRYSCPGSVLEGPISQWAKVLGRAYPRAAPGRLTSLTSDPDTGRLSLTGNGVGTLELWLPQAHHRTVSAGGKGIGEPKARRVPGGWQVEVKVSGAYTLEVAPSG